MVRKRRKTAMRRWRRCVPASGNATKGDGRVLTRRGFVFSLGAVAVGLIMYNPRMAFADEPWWDGSLIFRGYGARYASRFWNEVGSVQAGAGAEQAGNMYTGLQVSAKTPWVEWDISSRQFIRVATKITMACDFTTELYYHMRGKLEIACGSYNELNPSYNLWHTDSGDDTRFTLFHTVDGAPKGGVEEGSKVVVIDNEAGAGIHRDGCHVWTDYRGYPGSDYSVWIRRTDRDAMHGFQLRSWFWNYYYYGKDWYYQRADDPPIGFSTKWVKQCAKRVGIASEAQWAGRVLVISPATVPSLQLGVDGPRTGQGCGVFAAASSTRRHWIAVAHEDERFAGTFRFVPVCAGDGSLLLGQAGGGPRFDASAAELQRRAGADRAQAVWVHGRGSRQWLFSDCSGMALDRVGASQENGARVQFHSNGYADGEWGNESHMWHLEDARFGTEDGGLFDLEGAADGSTVAVGASLGVPDPRTAFRPGGASADAKGIRYEYLWFADDGQGEAVSEVPEVTGRACVSFGGGRLWLDAQPAANVVGTRGRAGALRALNLSAEGSGLGLVARIVSSGAWRDVSQEGAEAQGLSIKLGGDAASCFHVCYRVCGKDGSWSEWVQDGQEASCGGMPLHGVSARIVPAGLLEETGRTLQIGEHLAGKRLACIVRATTAYLDAAYLGCAVSKPLRVVNPFTTVRYFVDGEREPCWSERVDESSSYCVAPDARTAALKPGCEKVEGWFADAACTVPFADGAVVQGATLDLFGRNIAEVRYALTDMARQLFSERRCFADKQLEAEVDGESMLPPVQEVAYGEVLSFSRRPSVWYEAEGRAREAVGVIGAYADASASQPPAPKLKVTCSMTAYLGWILPRYEGIWVS